MRTPVFVGSAFVAQYPTGGGIFWVPLQYVLGLRDLGVDVRWLEYLWSRGDHHTDRDYIAAFLRYVRELGVADRVVLGYLPDSTRDELPRRIEYFGMSAEDLAARRRDALLVNLAHSVTPPLREGFGRTALHDIDPGPFQLWAREHDLGVGGHDVHLTIGQNLGAPDSPVPLGDVVWERLWPCVHLPSWPVAAAPATTYTTVTQWWSQQYAFLDGETYDCNKRTGFLEVVELPQRAGVPLELAANIHPVETEDLALLARHGWRIADPAAVAGTPAAFRRYVQGSRGEFSCAKPAYVKARAGWISDRTVCYLASGRPCVVEDTGAREHLPPSAGLSFFRTLDEAVVALRAIEADHRAAARAARVLAEEVFSTDVVLPQLLAACGA
jgi:hypothetical protein